MCAHPQRLLTLGGPGLRLSIQDGSATPLAGIADDIGEIKRAIEQLCGGILGLEYSAHPQSAPSAGDLAWVVHHSLSGAPGIEKLIEQGKAQRSVEARCAETLCTFAATSPGTVTTILLRPVDVGAGTVHLWPGVVTVDDCVLDTTGTSWAPQPVELPAGRYLARGAPHQVDHRQSDPMVFIPDPSIEPETTASIKVGEWGQDSRFEVRARPDRIIRLQHDEPALLACWATALAMLPAHDIYNIETDLDGRQIVPDSQIGDLIMRRLQAEKPDITLWDDKAAWDPMRAASLFIGLVPDNSEEHDQ